MIPLSRRGFEELEISVLEAGDHMWLSARSPQGSVFAVKRPLPEWKLPRDVTGRPVDEPGEWLTDAVRHARPDAGPEALEVGRVLTDLVFGVPEIGTLLQQTRGTAGTAGNQLLIRVLAAPSRIAAWPWELLLDPQRPDRFLSMARDVHVVRSGRSRTYPIRQAPIDPPLNLLLVMSSPLRSGPDESEAPFDLYAEKRSLLTELQPMVDRGLLRVVVEDRPSVER
ncbi:peptidase S8, partial [Rhodococcus oxybenzonivorans]|nr:peptidase S8 [Rhodococcus oxybenzonivorans]